ncbi:hypothetical protein [Actimicrobium antarcticum]|uniref:HTH cro/C1-type domain-containing protein n=1 Tax=Actimicrobium antarcticum TaxID=1051899 RepID=A0ABP7TUR7_9BURK
MLTHAHYDPERLLEFLKEHLNLTSDADLSKALHISRALIVQIREGRRPVAGGVLILMHEATQIGFDELRSLLGDRRRTWRMQGRIPSAA